jgi:predicted aspartyl protease
MYRSERCSGMPHLADLSSGHPNSKEDIDLQCLRNSHNSLAHGQMLNNFNREAALIVVSMRECGSLHQRLSSAQEASPRENSNQNNQSKGKRPMMQVRQGRVNFTTLAELPNGAPIMSGTFSIHHKPVVTLFDSGATHSFINNDCGTRIGLDLCHTRGSYMISTPGGKVTSNQMVKSVPIQLGSKLIKTD